MGEKDGKVFILGGSIADLKRMLEPAKTIEHDDGDRFIHDFKELIERAEFMNVAFLFLKALNQCSKSLDNDVLKATQEKDYSYKRLCEMVKHINDIIANYDKLGE